MANSSPFLAGKSHSSSTIIMFHPTLLPSHESRIINFPNYNPAGHTGEEKTGLSLGPCSAVLPGLPINQHPLQIARGNAWFWNWLKLVVPSSHLFPHSLCPGEFPLQLPFGGGEIGMFANVADAVSKTRHFMQLLTRRTRLSKRFPHRIAQIILSPFVHDDECQGVKLN